MPLVKSTLSQSLEAVYRAKPSASAQAAADWAQAYLAFAATALSSAGSLPVTAAANLGILLGAFTGAFEARSASGAASLMASGVTGFWSAMVWAGPAAVGTTLSPGNMSLASALAAVFSDTSDKSDGDKARQIADAFEAGAKTVMVNDIPLIQPAPPIVGPIS